MVEVLQKGANSSLLKNTPQLNEIIVAVKWAKQLNDETEFDIDTSAFMLTEQNKVRTDSDFIFYNQSTSLDNSIILKNQLFKVTLNSIAEDINKISFVLSLHDAKQKQQHFGLLGKITIELFNFVDKQKLISYTLVDINSETAIILGVLYRYNIEWKFRAMGQGYTNGLAVLARNFGVDIEEPAEQQPPPIENPLPEQPQNQITPLINKVDKKNYAQYFLEQQKNQAPPIINSEINSQNSKTNSKKPSKSKTKKSTNKQPAQQKTPELDIHNTNMMTKQDHYQPIVQWLMQRNFQAEVNEAAMDTSGFFDEIAVELGDNYGLLKIVIDTIKRRQLGKYDRAYIDLSRHSRQDITSIQQFCKRLYDYAFVAKYFYKSDEKTIVLQLQAATKITNFFNGEWLEWYAVMKIANLCHQQKIKFSCTRNMIVYLPDDNTKYEIDVFFLVDDLPLFIECKSGEYRSYIDKYSRLRRKLFMPKPYFLMLTLGVDDNHVNAFSATFDITFVNENMLVNYIIEFFVKKKPIDFKTTPAKPLKAETAINNKTLTPEPFKTKQLDIKNNNKELAVKPLKNNYEYNHKKSLKVSHKPLKSKRNYFLQPIIFICILVLVGFLIRYR